jgi:hypothetical protein
MEPASVEHVGDVVELFNQEEQRSHQPEKKPPSATAMPAMANM